MKLIGSKALELAGIKLPAYRNNKNSDTDFLVNALRFDNDSNISVLDKFLTDGIEVLFTGYSSTLNNIYNNTLTNYIQPEDIFKIKASHRYFYLGKYKKSFKHLVDYSYLKNLLQIDTPDTTELTNYFIKNLYNNDSRLLYFPSLNKTKQEFFNDHVTYYVDHDYLHELVAIDKLPAYTKCLTGEVNFSNKLFNNLDYDSKVHMVLEESFVLALERCLIPPVFNNTNVPAITPNEAFKYALTRVATNITSGDFRAFAADNFYKIYEEYLTKYSEYFKVMFQLKF